MDSQQYWNNKIIEWEDSQTGQGQVSLVENMAKAFRKPLAYRAELVKKLLKPVIGNKKVLALGCASGYFDLKLCQETELAHLYGLDMSEAAIARANKLCIEQNLSDRATFTRGDLNMNTFPEVDIVYAQGVLDYLTADEIRELFAKIKGRLFVFTFSQRNLSWERLIHICYIKSQHCPKHFYYSKAQIKSFAKGTFENVNFINDKKLSFGCIVHNIENSMHSDQ